MSGKIHLLFVLAILFCSADIAGAQQVSGTVTDAQTGDPLVGVNILVKGTSTGTVTNAEGHYSLSVPSLQDSLRFSYIGYETKTVHIDGRTTINITLQPKIISGEQIVVVGYGTQQKQNLTGSVATISSKELQTSAISNAQQALQGRIAGVSVHKNSHAPGGSISVRVHGTASLAASGKPLYVVNGIPIATNFVTEGSFAGSTYGGPAPNPLNSINMDNVASITVLKGPSATAIYGSRGANGVVLITTKHGKEGQQHVDFKSTVGFSHISNKLDFMTAHQYAVMTNEHDKAKGRKPTFTQLDTIGIGSRWQNLILQNGLQQKYNLTFLGGSDKIQYLIAGNYSDNNGIVRNSKLKQYEARINLNANISNRFTVGTDMAYSIVENHRTMEGSKGYYGRPSIALALVVAPPTAPARDKNGVPVNINKFPGGSVYSSPLEITDRYLHLGNTNRFLGNIHATYDILDNLSLRVRLGGGIRNWRFHSYIPKGSLAAVAFGSGGIAHQRSIRNINLVDNNTITYRKNINNNQSLKVLAGYTLQIRKNESLKAAAWGFPSNFYKYNNLGIGSTKKVMNSHASKSMLVSYLGRINYTLFNKYLITGSVRVDGSSKFGANNKYGTFPSASVAWRLGNEKFMNDVDAISHLKLRVGWGKTGNASIGYYASQALIGTGFTSRLGYLYNGTLKPVAYPNGIANPDLSWEKTSAWNFGLDIGFVNDRLSLNVTYYRKKTTDLLLNVPIPVQTGFSTVLENTGSMNNRGIGFKLSSVNVRNKSFKWTTHFNISHNRNRITSLGNSSKPYIYAGFAGGGNIKEHGGNVARNEVGHPVGAFYGRVYAGVWHTQQEIDQSNRTAAVKASIDPGNMRWKDLNGDGKIDQDDEKFLGSGNPDFTYGLTNDFNYKNWNLHVFIYGKYGNEVLNLTKAAFVYRWNGTSAKRVHRWTPDNTDSNIPGGAFSRMKVVNSAIVENGTFLRIQNISLNYHIPVNDVLRNATVGVAVDNAYVFTQYDGFDPEVNGGGNSNKVKGVDLYDYPAARTFRFTLKIGF